MEQLRLQDTRSWEDEAPTHGGHARLRIKISEMHCSLCSVIIERALLKQPGVYKVSVSLSNQQALIEGRGFPFLLIGVFADRISRWTSRLSHRVER